MSDIKIIEEKKMSFLQCLEGAKVLKKKIHNDNEEATPTKVSRI